MMDRVVASTPTNMSSPDQLAVYGANPLPVWLLLAGNVVMVCSLWLLGAGGMVAKLILLVFWLLMIAGFGGRLRFSGVALCGVLLLGGLIALVGTGNGAGPEKLRLIGNLAMLPVGLVAGMMIGRACLSVMMPSLIMYVPLSSSFYATHEGMRLNHPFLFLGLFALCSVTAWRGGKVLAGIAALAVLLSQTRIAVLAMMINLAGHIRFSSIWTWMIGGCVIAATAWVIADHLPRLLMTHGSGRLSFWRDFADMWVAAPNTQKWLGFGAGAVEDILSGYASFASFGALHNDHFRMLFETGIIGAGIWVIGWFLMIWMVRPSRLSMCILLSVMVTMVTDNSLNYGHYLMFCGIAAGIAARGNAPHG
ncbi:MAG: O-antigen ligase domain-containing protein [Thalassospira sp.]|uniref:O-antigen ligase family protein n=1 Tax=Thalassospira sp. TaxID=1912094 RepID=UPI0032EB16B1